MQMICGLPCADCVGERIKYVVLGISELKWEVNGVWLSSNYSQISVPCGHGKDGGLGRD